MDEREMVLHLSHMCYICETTWDRTKYDKCKMELNDLLTRHRNGEFKDYWQLQNLPYLLKDHIKEAYSRSHKKWSFKSDGRNLDLFRVKDISDIFDTAFIRLSSDYIPVYDLSEYKDDSIIGIYLKSNGLYSVPKKAQVYRPDEFEDINIGNVRLSLLDIKNTSRIYEYAGLKFFFYDAKSFNRYTNKFYLRPFK